MPGFGPSGVAPLRATERSPVIDPRAHRKLRRTIAVFALLVFPFGLVWLAYGLLIGDRSLTGAGLVAGVFSTYLGFEYLTSAHRPASSLATRAAVATNLAIIAAVTAEPVIGVAMTMAAIIPPVLALVHVRRSIVLRLMLLGGATSAYAAVIPSFLPWSSVLPFPLDLALPVTTLVIAYSIFQLFLWNASGQLTETATELSAAMDL